jgi:hypothetical protein
MLMIPLCLAACAPELPVGQRSQSALAYNALAFNAMAYNALAFNALAFNGLQIHGLDVADASLRRFVEYFVSCALPAGDEVVVNDVAFAGAIGLAPEWPAGACDAGCRRWISACLLARVNARGERVEISLRGPHPALRPGPAELAAFTDEEGTYYGDTSGQPWATSARDDLELPRTCGASIDGCHVNVVGHSDDACRTSSRARGRGGCHDAEGEVWQETITVFLRPR